MVESRMGAVAAKALPFPISAHRTGRADWPHAALRQSSPAGPQTGRRGRPQTHDAQRTKDRLIRQKACGASGPYASSENAERHRRQDGRPRDKPPPGSPSGSSSTRLAGCCSAGLALPATFPWCWEPGRRLPSAACAPHSSSTDGLPATHGHPSHSGVAPTCSRESQNSPGGLP